jgi:hypothetical protein
MNNIETGIAYTWDSYTPAWTSSGSAPAIGNGTLVGKYIQRGKWVAGFAKLTCGSTTTFGTGVYNLSLPVTSSAVVFDVLGAGGAYDASANSFWSGVAWHNSTTTIRCYVTGAGGAFATGAAIPFTFATTDQIMLQFTYEAA